MPMEFRIYQIVLYYLGGEQQLRWLDCMGTQADLQFCCSHVINMFCHD